MIHRHTRHPRALTLAISVGFLTMVAACGGGGSSSEVASLGAGDTSAATETTTAEDTQQQWLDFAQCMRDNGVDMQDPTFDADGNLQGGFGPAAGLDPQDENTQTALQACRDLMPAFGPGSGGGPQFDRTAIQDAFNNSPPACATRASRSTTSTSLPARVAAASRVPRRRATSLLLPVVVASAVARPDGCRRR